MGDELFVSLNLPANAFLILAGGLSGAFHLSGCMDVLFSIVLIFMIYLSLILFALVTIDGNSYLHWIRRTMFA